MYMICSSDDRTDKIYISNNWLSLINIMLYGVAKKNWVRFVHFCRHFDGVGRSTIYCAISNLFHMHKVMHSYALNVLKASVAGCIAGIIASVCLSVKIEKFKTGIVIGSIMFAFLFIVFSAEQHAFFTREKLTYCSGSPCSKLYSVGNICFITSGYCMIAIFASQVGVLICANC